MMKQVKQGIFWGMSTLVQASIWMPVPMAQAQVRPGVTFELPEVCTADLAEAIPEPGQAPEALPGGILAPPPNPLAIPLRPAEVDISRPQPISLDQALDLAYRNNPNLESVRIAVDRSRATLEESFASLYPTVDLNGGIDGVTNATSGQGEEDSDGGSAVAALTGNLEAAYDIVTGGERSARIRAAALQLQQQQLTLEQEQEALRSQISLAYYDVQSTRERMGIGQDFLAETCRNLRDTILFYEAEVGTRFDVLRAEVQVAQARQDLILARSNWQTAQRRLAAFLNIPADSTIITTPVSIGGFWPLTLEESIVLALQNRAELEENLLQREVSQAQRQIALSAIRPRLQTSGSVNAAVALNDITSAAIPGLDSNTSAGFGLRLGSSWRVFDGGAAAARVRQAEQDQAIAESTFSSERNQIRLAVETAYFNLEANLANIDTARTSLEQARDALQLAQRRFDAGVGDQLEVLTAQRELTEAQVQLLDAVLGYNRSLVDLERAVSNLAD